MASTALSWLWLNGEWIFTFPRGSDDLLTPAGQSFHLSNNIIPRSTWWIASTFIFNVPQKINLECSSDAKFSLIWFLRLPDRLCGFIPQKMLPDLFFLLSVVSPLWCLRITHRSMFWTSLFETLVIPTLRVGTPLSILAFRLKSTTTTDRCQSAEWRCTVERGIMGKGGAPRRSGAARRRWCAPWSCCGGCPSRSSRSWGCRRETAS